ncbi:MAG: zinc-ribbon domain-containing protein, partial [Bifidobacterium castoris]|nr:zinc-ribbon domain-containing protein [Bifidobacterium castoris]
MAQSEWESCPNCGMNVSADAAVCTNCGMPLEAVPMPDRTRVATGMTSFMDETATFVPSVPPAPSAPAAQSPPPVVNVPAPAPQTSTTQYRPAERGAGKAVI